MIKHIELLSLWIEKFRIPSDFYTLSLEENNNEVNFKILVDKKYIGRILGIKGSISKNLRKLMSSIYSKYHKKVNIEIKER